MLKSARGRFSNNIVEGHKNLELIMQESFRKSFIIVKKPILEHQSMLIDRDSRFKLVRSRTCFQSMHLRTKSDF